MTDTLNTVSGHHWQYSRNLSNVKAEKILKNSLDLIPSVRIQIIGGKFTEGESDGIKCRLPFNFFLLYKSVLELRI